MDWDALTEKAKTFARDAHKGQEYGKGVDYFEGHVQKIVDLLPVVGHHYDLERCVIVAYLHDVLEDTDVTVDELLAIFPTDIVREVSILTNRPMCNYNDYIDSLCGTGNEAILVKYCDSLVNLAKSISDLDQDPGRRTRRIERYSRNIAHLYRYL